MYGLEQDNPWLWLYPPLQSFFRLSPADDLVKDLRDIPKSVSEGDYESSRHIALYQKNNDKIKNK